MEKDEIMLLEHSKNLFPILLSCMKELRSSGVLNHGLLHGLSTLVWNCVLGRRDNSIRVLLFLVQLDQQ